MRHALIWFVTAAMGFGLGCSDDDGTHADHDTGGGQPDAAAQTQEECVPATNTSIDPSFLQECPESVCETGGRCVPSEFLPPGSTDLLAACDATSTCVPDKFVEAGGEVEPEHCRSVGGGEGRCISKCVPQVADEADMLPQDVCEDDELCAPCYDPRTGVETGACTLACDAPEEPAFVFPSCCEGIGTCVPASSVPDDFVEQLPEDTCEDEGFLCAPDKFVADLSYSPPSCTPELAGELEIDLDDEGVCLAACVAVHANALATALAQSSCDAGEVCVPCHDPDGEDTGACDL
jgi:hypothetical protein